MRYVDNGVFGRGDGGLGNLAHLDGLCAHPLGRFHLLRWMGLVFRRVDWTVLSST